ncbi:MAG TPA: hypothetical protein VLT85_04115, partial [Terriglobales bacterium]|nr:hypothetical protein [Terriglobales bacterium]
PNCVKCGRPTREVLDKTFWWHDPVLFVLILLGVMVYVIVALIARKSCTLNVPVCEEHRRSYQSRRRIGRNLMLASIPLWAVIWIAGNGSDEAVGLGALVFLLVFVVGLIVRRAAGPIKPANIDKQTATFRGASESFLQLLPS